MYQVYADYLLIGHTLCEVQAPGFSIFFFKYQLLYASSFDDKMLILVFIVYE